MTNLGCRRWLGDGPRRGPSGNVSSSLRRFFEGPRPPGWPTGGRAFTCRLQWLLVQTPAFALSPCSRRYASGTSEYWQGRDGAALHSLDWSATHGGSARGRAGKGGASAILSSRLSAIYWSLFPAIFCKVLCTSYTRGRVNLRSSTDCREMCLHELPVHLQRLPRAQTIFNMVSP